MTYGPDRWHDACRENVKPGLDWMLVSEVWSFAALTGAALGGLFLVHARR